MLQDSLSRLIEKSEIGQLERHTFENFVTSVKSMPGFTSMSEANLKMAYEISLAFAKNPSGWLLLQGGYGCGKTHLAAAIANFRLNLGHFALFINAPDLLDYLRASFQKTSTSTFEERFDQVSTAPLLVIDDLGSQNDTGWTQEKLYQIFNHRYVKQLPTVITTNEDLDYLEPRIHSRLIDKNLTRMIVINSPDFRRPTDYQGHTDLSTLDLHGDKTFGTFDLREHELNRTAVNNLRRVFEAAFDYAETPNNWIIFNSVAYGNGKTHLAAAIANYRKDLGEQVLFVVVPALLDYLRGAFDPTSRVGLGKRFDQVKKAPLLVLDDLGTESATAWAREKLYQLINYRYNAKLPTVVTTATPILELDQRLATRMLDERVCDFWSLEVPSYRGIPKKEKKGEKKAARKKAY